MTSLIRDLAASTPEMVAAFDDQALVRAALAFEAALARATTAEGLIAESAAQAIVRACSGLPDLSVLAQQAAHAGTLAIPLVRWLREAADALSPGAGQSVHLGATSQDVADTALVLQARVAAALIERDLDELADRLAALAQTHAATPMIGRTLMQQALPTTFGLKVAHWMASIDSAATRFRREKNDAIRL